MLELEVSQSLCFLALGDVIGFPLLNKVLVLIRILSMQSRSSLDNHQYSQQAWGIPEVEAPGARWWSSSWQVLFEHIRTGGDSYHSYRSLYIMKALLIIRAALPRLHRLPPTVYIITWQVQPMNVTLSRILELSGTS